MIERFITNIEREPIKITGWVIGFIGILFVRFILEALSSPTTTGVISADTFTLVHYGLFFLSVVLGTTLIVGYIVKNYIGALKIMLLGLPIIWIAPIVDMVLSQGRGFKMTYIFDTHQKLLLDFFTFFGPNVTRGATYGIRIEIAFILMGIGIYVWLKTRDVLRTFLAVLLSYLLGFIFATLPGILFTITQGNGSLLEVLTYFESTILNSNIFHNTLIEGSSSVSPLRFFELGFNKLMSQLLFLISVFFGGLLLWRINSNKFLSVVRNIRPERINFYISSLVCGMGYAYINKMGSDFIWIDLLGIACLIISWISLWMYAVHLNDIEDIEIDKISNQSRPLVTEEITKEEMRDIATIWLVVGLLGAWSAGFYPFFMSLVYVFASYIYSCPPLRLRRFPILPSFLISVVCLATILAGFFFVSIHKELQAFPPLIALGVLVIVTLAINFKDLKDIEGDKANGIITLATMFPKNSHKIIGSLLSLSILLTPIFLSFYLLYIFAIPASVIGYKLVTKKPYNEKPIFTLRFVFLACMAVSYLVVYWFANVYNLI